MRAVAVFVALVAAGCASDTGSPDTPAPDAQPPSCNLSLVFSPAVPQVGFGPISMRAVHEGPSGIYSYVWKLTRHGAAVEFETSSAGDEIHLTPAEAGIYDIAVSAASSDIDCVDAAQRFHIRAAGALDTSYRIRVVPGPSYSAPSQELVREVWGGAEYYLGVQSLDPGIDGSGQLSAGGDPQAGFIRVTRVGSVGPEAIELFAGSDGQFDLRVAASGTYDMLVVPSSPAVAPELRRNLTPGAIAGSFAIADGDSFTGTVSDGAGAPVAGATVQLMVDGVPSTLAITDAGGGFSLVGRAGSGAELVVTPDPASGLPRLSESLSSVSAGDSFAVAYSSSLVVRSHAPVLRYSTSALAAGARATFTASIGSAGTVSVNGGAASPAGGSVRISATAGAGGALPSTALVDAAYQVVLEPAAAAPAGEVPMIAAASTSGGASLGDFTFSDAATVQGSVVGASGGPVVGARIAATGRGALSNFATASATAITDDAGNYSLPLAATGNYEVVITPPVNAALAPQAVIVGAPAAGQTSARSPSQLDSTIQVVGEITIPGIAGNASGVQLLLFCSDCSDADVPLAQATTDELGRFVLRAPDPGVSP